MDIERSQPLKTVREQLRELTKKSKSPQEQRARNLFGMLMLFCKEAANSGDSIANINVEGYTQYAIRFLMELLNSERLNPYLANNHVYVSWGA